MNIEKLGIIYMFVQFSSIERVIGEDVFVHSFFSEELMSLIF